MAKQYKHIRYTGWRSPLALVIYILIFLIIFEIIYLSSNVPSYKDKEMEEFLTLINKAYDKTNFEGYILSNADLASLNTKINNNMSNSQNFLFDNNGDLKVDIFNSNNTRVNNQFDLTSGELGWLLDLEIKNYLGESDLSIMQVLHFDIFTNQNLTSVNMVAKIDLSMFVEMFASMEILGGQTNLPEYIYITLKGQIDNTKANDYVIYSNLVINDLNETDNKKVLDYINKYFSIKESQNISTIFIPTIVSGLQNNLKNWNNVNASFQGTGIVIG